MIKIKAVLKDQIYVLLKENYRIDRDILEINTTPQIKFGDLALAFPFQLAKSEKRPPRELAAEIAPLLSSLEGVEKVEVAGAGYINLFLKREEYFRGRLTNVKSSSLEPDEKKIIVEHTNINPNKAAHIGHLRNAILGDTLVRCLKYKGEEVETQNYIDDTGVQVVDVVFGFMEMEKKTLEDIEKIPGKFDYYCWDLYTKVSSYFENLPDAQEQRSTILKKIEEGHGTEYAVAFHVSRRIIAAHLDTMKRLEIDYDILPCESSILHLKFWDKAFQLLQDRKAIYFVDEGVNKGCWVMKLEEEPDQEKIIVRSDGTVTYVGKDIAYQLWKFGLLQKDFQYEPFRTDGDRILWITSSKSGSDGVHFGSGSKVYNVIDTRQSYLQKVVVQGLKALGFTEEAEKSIHFAYEMVALSPKSLKELDIEVSDKDKEKGFLEVSGRKGVGVKADDLLDRLEEKAQAEVEKRNPELPQEKRWEIAHQIAVGALRYFMLKFVRNSLIVFDFEEALSFEGETGPYLQYSYVRINSIFRKLEDKFDFTAVDLEKLIASGEMALDRLDPTERDDFWELSLYASQFEEEVLHSIKSLEFSHLAKYSFNLCQKLNGYYHKYSIIAEKDIWRRNNRILTIYYIREVLDKAFRLMGIPKPDKM